MSNIPGQSTGQGWNNANIGTKVSRLGSLSKKIGPNYLTKVMAGDVLSATVQYYYKNPVTNSTGNNLTTNVVSTLMQAITGSGSASSLVKGATTPISSNLGIDPLLIGKTAPDAANASGNAPKAYLTVLFFDERFKFVEEGSSSIRVSQADAANAILPLANLKAPKNGYVYIYVSNESSEYVYFDNLQVGHTRGRIIEEDHYYAFGLKIAGISSVKLGDANEGLLKNQNLYNDKELWDEADLNWYDYGFRNYDAQIGRFPQLDPLTDDYPYYTPYQYAGNEPIANVDLDGLEPYAATVTVTAHIGKATSQLAGAITRLGTSLVVNAVALTSTVANKLSTQTDIFKGNTSNRWNIFKQATSEHFEKVKTNLTPGSDYWEMIGNILKDGLDFRQAGMGPLIGAEVKELEVLYKLYSGEQKLLTGKEILLKFKSYEQARNSTLDIIGDLGPGSKPYKGRLKGSEGYEKTIGRQSADGKVRWRLDYDSQKGIHINVEDFRMGKGSKAKKHALQFDGNESTYKSLLKHLNE